MAFRLVLATCGLFLAASIPSCHAENQAAINEFGVEKSKPLNGAFFFWNYRYVEAPYVVGRRGLDSFVNGILVRPRPAWPLEDLIVQADPGNPPAWTSPAHNTKRNNFCFDRKWRYLSGRYDLAEARRLMVEVHRESSGVSEVRWDGGDELYVKDQKGVQEALLFDTWWKHRILTREQVLEQAEHSVKDLERLLRLRGFFFWICDGSEIGMPCGDALNILGVMFSEGGLAEKTKEPEKHNLREPEMARAVHDRA